MAFTDVLSKVPSKRNTLFNYHEALNMRPEDITMFKRHRGDAKKSVKSLHEKFSSLLESCHMLDEQVYTQLKELKDDRKMLVDEGNKQLEQIIVKLETEMVEYNSDNLPRRDSQMVLYRDLTEDKKFMQFTLLQSCELGSFRFVAQLLSLIKSALIDGRDLENQENTENSSNVVVDDTLFYDVIIPVVLLAYVDDKGTRKAKQFVDFTDEGSYNLYDSGDRKRWPNIYIRFLDHIEKHNTLEDIVTYEQKDHSGVSHYIGPLSGLENFKKYHPFPQTSLATFTRIPIPHSFTMSNLQDAHKAYSLEYNRMQEVYYLKLALTQTDYENQKKIGKELEGHYEK
ncbi:hypothetical protein IWQ62_005312 [Dispira parvispora]|uniref:Uncharacterized protein n=1 Tax=Dispira parvispora TaxID=1520584 RepID=A0A9W8AR49_9FUNG|nr:hypothetical protein IWQ62_005312 [Dispira parvispora]